MIIILLIKYHVCSYATHYDSEHAIVKPKTTKQHKEKLCNVHTHTSQEKNIEESKKIKKNLDRRELETKYCCIDLEENQSPNNKRKSCANICYKIFKKFLYYDVVRILMLLICFYNFGELGYWLIMLLIFIADYYKFIIKFFKKIKIFSRKKTNNEDFNVEKTSLVDTNTTRNDDSLV
ncbi:uncharacterized protein VNE69_03087 [Vairimorpha necatrix]|uniref:Membrane protein n=1 Tax=Vairimorpha necatrix TaxID=6039 RepID=A0AAX4JAE3_9MICR